MASRSGPRAAGTDGSDFSHREQIVSHYKASADLKTGVRKCLIPHMLLTVVYIGKHLAAFMGSKYFLPLEYWEQIWLISGIGAFIGFGALQRNDIKRLLVYLVGNLIFGVVPLGFGVVELVAKIQSDFKDMNKTPDTWKNQPMKMAMIAVCLSWQVAGIIQSIRLIKIWRSMGDRKKKDN